MIAHVLFKNNNPFEHPAKAHFDHVADVTINDSLDTFQALEFVWRRIQNLDGSWSMGELFNENGTMVDNPDFDPRVAVLRQLPNHLGRKFGHRSMMVGDRVLIDGEAFEVASFGFEKVRMLDAALV